jgi:hypothetical protein
MKALVTMVAVVFAKDCTCYDSVGECIDTEVWGSLCSISTVNYSLLSGVGLITLILLLLDHFFYKPEKFQ